MKRYLLTLGLLFLTRIMFSQAVANFTTPDDTVCTNDPVALTQASTNATTYYWTFCGGDLLQAPQALSLLDLDPTATNDLLPVRITLAHEGNEYYAFVTNHRDSSITRLKFNGSYMDPAPTMTVLDRVSLQNKVYTAQGIQVAFDPLLGRWIGFVVCSDNIWPKNFEGHLVRMDFGTSLNNIPTLTVIDAVKSHMMFPQGMQVVQDNNGDWFVFVASSTTFVEGVGTVPASCARYYFKDSLTATPVFFRIDASVSGLGSATALSGPKTINVIQNEIGDWYGFALNDDNTFTRMYFGNSLNNKPTGDKQPAIANIGGAYEFHLLEDCNHYYAPTISQVSKGLIMVRFEDLQSAPSSSPNISSLSNPHGLSEFYRIKDTLLCFVMNSNGELVRLTFPGCNNPDLPASSLSVPNYPVTYKVPGSYKIRLNINDGTVNQSSYCKEIQVLDPPTTALPPDSGYCFDGTSITLNADDGFTSYTWLPDNTTGKTKSLPSDVGPHQIILNAQFHTCGTIDTFNVEVFRNPDISSDQPFYMQVAIHADSGAAPYEYKIDNYPYSATDSVYNGVGPGDHQISIRDAKGCVAVQSITVERVDIMIPNYFTPNNDSKNDRWYIGGIENFPSATIKIYDRYGVLLATFTGADFLNQAGWDGTYEGKVLPSDDYWYYLEVNDGRKPYAGHVTLKR